VPEIKQITQIISDLNKKIYHPVYFFQGEEPFYIDYLSDFMEENILTETEKEFNHLVVYGKDTTAVNLINLARQYPMMSNFKVIIVKEAQQLDKIDALQPYIEKPLTTTILVLCYKYKKIDKRTGFFKSLQKNSVFYESSRIRDEDVPGWINQYLRERGYTITPKASQLLFEYLGNELAKIVNEIGKMIINIPAPAEINENDIETYIGISKDFNIFELQKAIGRKDIYKANQIINYFADNPKNNPLIKTIAILYAYFCKILIFHQLADKNNTREVAAALSVNPYFLNDYKMAARNYSSAKLVQIISLLRKYDGKIKGIDAGSASEGDLSRELLFHILH